MAPNKDKLKGTIAELHEQLRDADAIDGETKELLAAALDDIRATLAGAKDGGQTDLDQSLVDQLRSAASRFEATHPTLAGTVEQLVDALSRMGI